MSPSAHGNTPASEMYSNPATQCPTRMHAASPQITCVSPFALPLALEPETGVDPEMVDDASANNNPCQVAGHSKPLPYATTYLPYSHRLFPPQRPRSNRHHNHAAQPLQYRFLFSREAGTIYNWSPARGGGSGSDSWRVADRTPPPLFFRVW